MDRKVKAIALVQKLIKERSGVDVAFEKHDDYTYTCKLKIDGVDSLSLKEKSMCLFLGHEYDGFLPIEIDVRWVYLRGGNNGHTIMYVWYKDGSLKIREVGGSLVEWKPKLTMQQYAKEVFEYDLENMGFEVLSANIAEFKGTLDKKIYEFLLSGLSNCESDWEKIDEMGFDRDTYCKELAKEYALLFVFKDDEEHFKIL